MEVLVIVLIVIILFLSFWVKNLISKLKYVANNRADVIEILDAYAAEIKMIIKHPYYSGDELLRGIIDLTNGVIKYLERDTIYDQINFIYDDGKEKSVKK